MELLPGEDCQAIWDRIFPKDLRKDHRDLNWLIAHGVHPVKVWRHRRFFDGIPSDSRKLFSEERAVFRVRLPLPPAFRLERADTFFPCIVTDCCKECTAWLRCTRRCVCVSAVALFVLGIIAAIIGLAVTFGIPPRTPVNRFCVTSNNRTGFLCDDRESCIPAHQVCNRIRECANGEDEQETLCSDLPNSLPGYLIFRCSYPSYWIYADKRCNGFNDCGDCSDEMGTLAGCPPCGPQWWSCTPVFYEYCTCVPRSFCRDGVQHCTSWSDEYICMR
ncbi:low-density lipoprotein receptor class A domain-containing protein 1 [Alligator mississippiensis]|uniref:low-density lipoprotein receptor class A domain-containing protein 1 n=1 Tax=Alligator mississippiensis TaxID=8496 RepID=UPI002877E8DC|nr:low-density lipoprotein receptor class A domain-containing protein 1 [Alligator mississippiensis]